MADQASSTITINASPEAVLEVIRDLPAYPQWASQISRTEVVEEGPDGPAKATFWMSTSGLSDEYTLAYTWRPDGVSWSLVKPSAMMKTQSGSYQLTADGSGTKVTYLLTLEIKIPMSGLMKRKAEKMIIDSALKELKKRVESLG